MGDPQTTLWQEVNIFLTKALGWLVWIIMGVAAKLAFDSRTRHLTRRDIIIKSILSIFVGFISAVICKNRGYKDWIKIVVPVSTLLGEGVVVWVMVNWKKWAEKLLPPVFKNGKDESKQ